uniref:Ig-like domain-containing protein n=1 Tax=Poecilia latipinna TaxID=48699 RepID=A0A3B3U7L7_9TELE
TFCYRFCCCVLSHCPADASVTVQPGQRLTISCHVSYDPSSFHIHWIRQPAGKGLEWIGYTCQGCDPVYKDSLTNKFSFTVDSSSLSVTLNGQNLHPQDSAVYYCARSPTVTQHNYRAAQKPLRT